MYANQKAKWIMYFKVALLESYCYNDFNNKLKSRSSIDKMGACLLYQIKGLFLKYHSRG